jgi:ligand-binding SRPBCC domain-containing protein
VSQIHILHRDQVVPLRRAEVFAFFAEPRNLEAITPEFLRFQILPPVPCTLEVGSRIDYRLSLFGVPFRWRTRIAAWEPGYRFVDVQERGPYAL